VHVLPFDGEMKLLITEPKVMLVKHRKQNIRQSSNLHGSKWNILCGGYVYDSTSGRRCNHQCDLNDLW